MNELQNYIIDALKSLVDSDIELIKNQPKEECINHRLAKHLEDILRKKGILAKLDLSVDVEYDKYRENEKKSSDDKKIRPDIITHKRKSGNINNLIVIEAKKKYISKQDNEKIFRLVTSEDFRYSLGVGIAYLPEKEYMKIKFLLPNEPWENYRFSKNDFTIHKTKK
jgi:hypothetical protein